METIGIIGMGFVGTAILEGMKEYFKVACHDIKSGSFVIDQGYLDRFPSLEAMLKTIDGPIFICVPTPMNSDGSCHIDIVESVIKTLNDNCSNVVVIKSTVPPGTTKLMSQKYQNVDICFNPEFLTERASIEDFKNQDRIIVGGSPTALSALKLLYKTSFPLVPFIETTSDEAEMAKYVTNCFLATKVAFANEIEQLCSKLGINYSTMIELAKKDKRLGSSHWAVPGPDGKNGFGGKCFCKDLNALMALFREQEVNHHTMKGAWETNLELRPEKDWEAIEGVIHSHSSTTSSNSPPQNGQYSNLSVKPS